jgi:hypothetical protein
LGFAIKNYGTDEGGSLFSKTDTRGSVVLNKILTILFLTFIDEIWYKRLKIIFLILAIFIFLWYEPKIILSFFRADFFSLFIFIA